jgi:hypothetical protein
MAQTCGVWLSCAKKWCEKMLGVAAAGICARTITAMQAPL